MPRSLYITAEGHATLQQELAQLWIRRRDVTRHLAAAAAEGDRSENAEYIYRKKELRELDRRIRYLQKRLPELKVVRLTPGDHQTVYFGAWVTTELMNGDEMHFRIVGSDEIDQARRFISIDSPLARSVLGKKLDDTVVVATPTGNVEHTIIAISYSAPDGVE